MITNMNKIKEFFIGFYKSMNWGLLSMITLIINLLYFYNYNNVSIKPILWFNLIWFSLIFIAYIKVFLERKLDDEQRVNKPNDDKSDYENYINSIKEQIEYHKKFNSKIKDLEKLSEMTYEEYVQKYGNR